MLREHLTNKDVLINLLREELLACERQIVGLEITRDADNINTSLSNELNICASELTGVSAEISRYKGLYGDHEERYDPWEDYKMSDIECDSLYLPCLADKTADSSDSLEYPRTSPRYIHIHDEVSSMSINELTGPIQSERNVPSLSFLNRTERLVSTKTAQ